MSVSQERDMGTGGAHQDLGGISESTLSANMKKHTTLLHELMSCFLVNIISPSSCDSMEDKSCVNLTLAEFIQHEYLTLLTSR